MRQIGEAFYGRQAAYRAALAASGEEALAAALQRNVYEEVAPPGCAQAGCAQALAAYVREVERAFADQNADGFRHGTLSFPAPAEMQVDA
jgi:cytochrome b pre-mRNA-processing protein 3